MNNHTKVEVLELPKCDFCKRNLVYQEAHYDGKTKMGSWAYMCGKHFRQYGIGLGLGRGQELVLQGIPPSEGSYE